MEFVQFLKLKFHSLSSCLYSFAMLLSILKLFDTISQIFFIPVFPEIDQNHGSSSQQHPSLKINQQTKRIRPKTVEVQPEVPHGCSICLFRSTNEKLLELHNQCHQQESEFKCPICSFCAPNSRTLSLHQNRDHLQQTEMLGSNDQVKLYNHHLFISTF